MIDSSFDRDPVERLADEFIARCRKGESPSLFEYVADYPQYAEQIEKLFPAVAMMEQLRVQETGKRDAAAGRARLFDVPSRMGDFEILREIGRGGMGIVYEAKQRSLARQVAVKVLPRQVFLVDKHLQRFQREAQMAARLRHTGIVPIFGVGEQDGLHYYVMPLIRGVGLDEIIRELRCRDDVPPSKTRAIGNAAVRREDIPGIVRELTARKFPVAPPATRRVGPQKSHGGNAARRWITAARLGAQAAEALAYAHAQGTLHRDIKPGNLLVDADGNACLADFGLARAVDAADVSGTEEIVGTPRYMAPEQLRGQADARSDIYGLGLTLYELLTLRPAFDNHGAQRHSGGHRAPPRPIPPRKIDRAIPRDLEAMVLKCLAHEPSRRYDSAANLAAELRRFLADKPIRARRVSRLERTWRWCRRNPALALVSALALLLVVAFAATAIVGHVRTRIAYSRTRQALARADATSGVALQVLEDIYVQLSPDRVWISTDSDPAGQACACIGLRSARPATSEQERYVQVQTSEQTAVLLENLLVFYDRLAEQVSDDARVMLESAIATRRVGDIHQRLGQMEQAEKDYLRAVEKLLALRDSAKANTLVAVQLARTYNEIGNVRSARLDREAAYRAHQDALRVLESARPGLARDTMASCAPPKCTISPSRKDGRPAANVDSQSSFAEEYRYELARTYFLLSNRYASGSQSQRAHRIDGVTRQPAGSPFPDKEYRKSATDLLEQLARENPDAADYRFLLALCYRPRGIVVEPERGPASLRGRERALKILEQLRSEYPQVSDYRYELAATYAWVHVGLFPWQGRSTASPKMEQDLCKALREAQWLVEHNPTTPHYARCLALVLAKLGTIFWETDRLTEAADFYEQALQTQTAVVEAFPDLPAHDRVLREFFRLRLAAVYLRRGGRSDDPEEESRGRAFLETCVRSLAEENAQQELTDDRLATTSLQIAETALNKIRQD